MAESIATVATRAAVRFDRQEVFNEQVDKHVEALTKRVTELETLLSRTTTSLEQTVVLDQLLEQRIEMIEKRMNRRSEYGVG
jgi:DNA recombination-dependent growth factor C